jgi:hypothetical protein
MYLYDDEEIVRNNRTWVAIHDKGEMVKFTVPDIVNGERYENTLHNAIWLYMSAMKRFRYVSYERMLNLDDVAPKEILQYLPVVDFDPLLFEA